MLGYIGLKEDKTLLFTSNSPFHPTYGEHKTKEELELTGFFVDYIPEPVNYPDKYNQLVITGEPRIISSDVEQEALDLEYNRNLISYNYYLKPVQPPTVDERVSALELENAQLLKDIASKDLTILALQSDVADILKTMAQGGTV